MLQEPPSTDAFLPLPFLTLTLCPRGGGEQSAPSWWTDCPEEATGVHGHPRGGAGGGGGLTASGHGPRSILPRLFIPYSVTFLFYFTLIMIIQEYYPSDKFRVSFLIYNFLLR